MFEFERLHKLHFEIFKLAKKCTVNYLSSNRVRTIKKQKGGELFV